MGRMRRSGTFVLDLRCIRGSQVLDFKRSFNIVDRSHQKTADDIVGKMTIAKLYKFKREPFDDDDTFRFMTKLTKST
jgi:hypothetical protein